ncbi:MAG: hypothetical protein JXB10_19550 [Pirellulales bacterium]|nr:hypothetical protein [Pirellulales bacterium]
MCQEHGFGCCHALHRRDFMSAMGLSALAVNPGFLSFTSLAAAETASPPAPPRVRAVFLRPNQDRYWMGWPGAAYHPREREAELIKIMTDAAKNLGIDLQVTAKPIPDRNGVKKLLAECKQSPPDGILVTVGSLGPDYWPEANYFVAEKGDLPAVVFSPMGTSFTGHLQKTRSAKRTFVAATQDIDWLRTALRMFHTMHAMKNTRLCIINGDKTEDRVLDLLGTTLHFIPLKRWAEELSRTETTAEVRAMADALKKQAKKIVEPKPQDITNAAKNYFVAKKILAAENCHGISLNCLGLVSDRLIPCPPCMAWQMLNDEGSVGCCECDLNAVITLRLCSLLLGRPGFQQDPAPNTVQNTFMGAHCSAPTRLRGFDQPPEPQILRSHSESDIGVSPQVLWPIGEPVTVMQFEGPTKMILGTGKVLANIDTPPAGGCRTSVELALDGVADTRDCKGFHQLFVLGKHDHLLKAYCQLAGIEVVPLA